MFITYNDRGERIIFDGEALDYECLECGNKFERLIDYGCCCPNKWMRKQILEKSPTVCPNCHSRHVDRIRRGQSLYAMMCEREGRKPEEWED